MLRRPAVKLITQTCHTLAHPEPIFLLLQKHSKSKSITLCKQIHANLLKAHANPQVHISNTLLSFYSECGDLCSAHRVFAQMPHRNVVTWTSLISSCIRYGAPEEALGLFKEMLEANESPNPYTFSVVVRACTSGCLIELGQQVHGLIVKYGLADNEYTGSSLVDLYRKVIGSLSDAFCVFDRLSGRDLVLWNVMISGFAQAGDVNNVLRLFSEMREVDELKPNDFTLTSLLKCCCLIEDVEQIHGLALKFGFDGDVVVGSALVDLYGKCGDLCSGKKIFDSMEVKDGYSWSSMVTGHVRSGREKNAVLLFKSMLSQGVKPDQHVLSSTLRACREIGELETGIQIHSQTIKNGYQKDCFVGSGLINLYAGANEICEVEKLFRGMVNKDIVAWNTMIMCYAQMEEGSASLCISLLRELNHSVLAPDEATFVAVINSCKSASDLAMGVQVHCSIVKLRQGYDTSIGNALVRMYSDCENIESARKAFMGIAHKDEVSWSSLIGIYHQNGFDLEALRIFKDMLADGKPPTRFSLPLGITACAKIAAVDMGKQFHSLICKLGYNRDVYVGSSVVDMYAKCGSVEDAEKAFKEQEEPNEVALNSLISGFARDGNAHKAIQLFREMESMRFAPNSITFLTVLSACSHAGLVEESLFFFNLMMNQRYNMKPESEHYACLIDVLGRVGRLEEAYELVENGGCVFAWKTLLNACRNYENVKIAEKCAGKVAEIDPSDHSPYIILSNMYSREGKWEEASKLRQKMVHIGMQKNPGSSWLM
nr:pentatricopeptide repeat-containing protein At4g39530-like [Ipomoea batatas]